MSQPNEWSYSASDETPGARTRRRPVVIAVAAVIAVLVVALVTWLVWPNPAPTAPTEAAADDGPKPMLNEKPPTVIENGIEPRTLYPPGYVDFDSSKYESSRDSSYVPGSKYDTTSNPAGCEKDPLFEDRYGSILDDEDPDKYDRYPVSLLMYPVDDPGGNKEDTRGFNLAVWPAKNTDNLDTYRQWYEKCRGAKVTTTVSKDGVVSKQETRTQDESVIAAPSSQAADSFALARPDRDVCELYGLIRGMMVSVTCPPAQKAAGVQLWRTVIHRITDI